MSTLIPVEVIAEALAKHRWRGNIMGCGCGWNWTEPLTYACGEDERIERAHVAHQASVIAALPGIAIVALPEGESSWHIMDWDGGRVSLCHGGDTVRCYLPNPELEVKEAERLGIALIAASRSLAAGGES